MNGPITETAKFPSPSSISLAISATSITLDSSVTLSGMVTPTQPAGTAVVLSYSIDGGMTWSIFMTTKLDQTGGYSVAWFAPYSGTYQIKTNWVGNANNAASTSPVVTLLVTGTRPPQITLLVTGPGSASRGSSTTFDVLVTNPGASTTVTVYLDIIGPGGYEYFDTLKVPIATAGSARLQFTWQIPAAVTTGSYQVLVGLIPPTATSISQTQITVT
jgi:hypothetical protein